MNDKFPDIPFTLKTPLDHKIAEAFLLFDADTDFVIDAEHIPTIIGSLGCVPTESDIAIILESTELVSFPGKVHFGSFLPYFKKMLAAGKMRPSTAEELLEAFKILDSHDVGVIKRETFLELINELGNQMSQKQIDEMMNSAVDSDTNAINYEAYILQLITQAQESIFELMDE